MNENKEVDWFFLLTIVVIAIASHIMKDVGNGAPFSPRKEAAKRLARAVYTGFLSAAVWALCSEFWPLSDNVGVAVAVGVVVLGSEFVEKAVLDVTKRRVAREVEK